MDLDDPETLDKIIAEAIDNDKLEKRWKAGEELRDLYEGGIRVVTGWVKGMHANGQIEFLNHYKDGKEDGLSMVWYSNGQKKWEETYQDGKLVTAVAWKPNGEKCPATKVVAGNGVWVWYDGSGREKTRHTCKDGEYVLD